MGRGIMTNQARAEKIVQEFHGFDGLERKAMVELITSQLDEAVEEAEQSALLKSEKSFITGFRKAREQLAKRVEVNGMAGCYVTGKEIRKMVPK